ncbi:MAG: alanine--tRNA ligase-related protein, partial [Candidatus Micrarchaeaceae archaeon]
MISKDELRNDFSKKPKEYYTVKTFSDEGFERRQCKECRKHFWTTDSDRDLCGDPSHEPYSFMREKTKDVEYSEFWNKFSKFFKDEGHTIIERYPVVSRWRQDLYFTIASIQDFQRIENGRVSFEYNANPLLVPQICMRFNDIPNVGVTGRHFTSFMMAGQHAFDYPKAGYWRDRTIELDYKFLVDVLGVKKKDLTYVEDVWAMGDFSEFGPCLEGFANGLELVNNVFTQFEYQNDKISELKGKVV